MLDKYSNLPSFQKNSMLGTGSIKLPPESLAKLGYMNFLKKTAQPGMQQMLDNYNRGQGGVAPIPPELSSKIDTAVSNNTNFDAANSGLGSTNSGYFTDAELAQRNSEDYNFINNSDNNVDTESPGFFGKDGFGMDDAMNVGKLGLGAFQGYLGYKNYGLAKDTFEYNKMDRNRTYAANRDKYNNALARTAAVDSHYGSKTAGKKLV